MATETLSGGSLDSELAGGASGWIPTNTQHPSSAFFVLSEVQIRMERAASRGSWPTGTDLWR